MGNNLNAHHYGLLTDDILWSHEKAVLEGYLYFIYKAQSS